MLNNEIATILEYANNDKYVEYRKSALGHLTAIEDTIYSPVNRENFYLKATILSS